MTDTREATPMPMEARERLAEVMWRAEYKRGAGRERNVPWSEAGDPARKAWLPIADAVIAAFHLTDTAALALMEGEGVVVPNYPAGDVIGPCICGSWPGGRCLKCQTTTNPPYKENPND